MIQFCDLKSQQRYIIQNEVTKVEKQFGFSVESLCNSLKKFSQATKCLEVPSSERSEEIETTKSKDNLSDEYYKKINDHSKRQISFSFPFVNSKSFIFSSKKIETYGNQFLLTKKC